LSQVAEKNFKLFCENMNNEEAEKVDYPIEWLNG
jgi:hypothetical protein